MTKVTSWIKTNKLTTVLLVVVGYLLFRNSWGVVRPVSLMSTPIREGGVGSQGIYSEKMAAISDPMGYSPDYAPTDDVTDRIVITESSLSLLVKKVTEAQKAIQQKAEELGGYLVNTNTTNANETTAASGNITIRVPQSKLDQSLDYFRGLAVKVVFENINGRDVTDEYVDIDTRLNNLGKVKAKYEEILTKAEKVDEIMQVQNQIVSLQSQIDNLKGQQKYLDKSSELSKIVVYLSTDEMALPYTPSETWRPNVIFRKAVRSLVGSLRKLGTLIIWVAVYSVVWLPILIIYKLILRRKKRV